MKKKLAYQKILCTLGPASLNEDVIKRLTDRGVDFFRINMSHTSIPALKEHIDIIRKYSEVPICIDSEGAQIRVGPMEDNVNFEDRKEILVRPGRITGNEKEIGLWPGEALKEVMEGHIIAVDFDSVLLLVTEILDSGVRAIVLNGGKVGSNKAVTVFPSPSLPPLSEKDLKAIEVGLELGIKNYALSFANCGEDVKLMRSQLTNDCTIISKVESRMGVRNLNDILEESDAILIDRGDLSREVPLENIPFIQKLIINVANSYNTPVYVATNLLESMMVNRKPTRAELSDVINTLLDGANGLVLAAETAIGQQPVAALDMLRTLIERFNQSLKGHTIEDLLDNRSLILPALHGTDSRTKNPNRLSVTRAKTEDLLTIDVDIETSLDAKQLTSKVYSPLSGFMVQEELESVLDRHVLPSGTVWPIPIILQIPEELWRNIKVGMCVALRERGANDILGYLHIRDLYEIDLESVSERWFGTNSDKHPGVERLLRSGKYVVGGEIESGASASGENSRFALTPEQSKLIFSIKGWSKVIAFHSRNVPHRAHEYVMLEALRRSNADGLFIQPVVGPKKTGDFLSDHILRAYEIFIAEAAPGALLSSFATYSRYSGPREAVFTALCRKNFGCTHFIIGRDHTGVGNFYSEFEAERLFGKLGDIGIEPVFMGRVGFDEKLGKMIEHTGPNNEKYELRSISGTEARKSLLNGGELPSWYMRPSIVAYLEKEIKEGRKVFVD